MTKGLTTNDSMRIALIYNEPKHTEPEDHWLSRSRAEVELEHDFRDASEFGVLEEIQVIAQAIKDDGHDVLVFSVDDDIHRLITFLDKENPDLIFNLCEAVLGKASLEMPIAGIYELYDIPYTGSPAIALGIALNKGLSKAIFKAHDIPTPAFVIVDEEEFIPQDLNLAYPLIVKPVREDASIGIDNNSICADEDALEKRIAFVHKEFHQPALVEEYIDGREINVAVLAGESGKFETLPVSEILFDTMPAGNPRIVSYEAKWVEESPLYQTTIPKCPAELDVVTTEQARELALRAAAVVGLSDYGRIDMRLRDSDNALFVLEANPNPDISRDAGFMRAAGVKGYSHAQTIGAIVRCAMRRVRK
ncbi:MAG: D-alanine--D-alanine ligase [Bacteroidota bacterium]|nr:D-alanine--D-alanine ligase [Bacteroidota bacterium]MDP4231608.1 D-alanine--D-alanine ligase [Bacteroidota bacterium]MDP4236648.1 D-alanine--D-alanine ligase [Bacteroidota bacterium]